MRSHHLEAWVLAGRLSQPFTRGSWKTPERFYRLQYNDSRRQQGRLGCFSMSVSEVKHTSLFLNIDFSFPPLSPSLHFSALSLHLPRLSFTTFKQLGLLREVNCTQIMFDRERSEGVTEKRSRGMEGGIDVRERR